MWATQLASTAPLMKNSVDTASRLRAITVYATLMIPTNILTEAALSFLGAGVKPPTASWGQMLSKAVNTYESDPLFMVIPGLAIFITVLAFNLFGDGVRDALDPKGSR